MRWLVFVRPGDCLTALIAAVFCAVSFPLAWQAGTPEKALIKLGGKVFAELDLSRSRQIDVPGPLGTTRVVVEQRRVRVASDPGPRQY